MSFSPRFAMLLSRFPRTAGRSGVALLLALVGVLLTGASSCDDARAATIERGTRGYGLSVFEGDQPQRFEVEFLGRIEGWGATGATLLARLHGPVVERTGVQQGMSGSPVYVDGELVGAIMSTWSFASEPIAGIRPIEEMRAIGADLLRGDLGSARRVEPGALARVTEDLPGTVVLGATGFASSLRGRMASDLGIPVVAGASAAPEASGGKSGLEPGDALAVLLVDGDARLFATGTVTEVAGEVVTAFGHPFLGAGAVSLPMARAEVITVLPSREISFKIASAGPVVGAVELDRRAGIAGRLGQAARTIAVDVEVGGGGRPVSDHYRFRLARLPGLTPQLLGWSVQSAIQDLRVLDARSTLRLQVQTELADGETLRSESALAGAAATQSLGAELALPLQLLEVSNTPLAEVASIEVSVEVGGLEASARLGRVLFDPEELRPGGILHARVEIEPWRASPQWLPMEIELPDRLAPGRYLLHFLDGGEAFREEVGRGAARWASIGPRQIREALALRTPAHDLVAVLYGPSASAVVEGVEWRDLPGTVRAAIGRGRAGTPAAPVTADVLTRARQATPWVLSGAARFVLEYEGTKVSRPHPAAPERSAGGAKSPH